MSSARYFKVAKKLGLAVLALGSFAGAGNAPLCPPVTTNSSWNRRVLPTHFIFTAKKLASLFGLPRPILGFSPAVRD